MVAGRISPSRSWSSVRAGVWVRGLTHVGGTTQPSSVARDDGIQARTRDRRAWEVEQEQQWPRQRALPHHAANGEETAVHAPIGRDCEHRRLEIGVGKLGKARVHLVAMVAIVPLTDFCLPCVPH